MTERRPRRTAKRLEADIRAAIIDALVEDGYAGITFEGIARRCDVSKPVLYRRYPDRSSMVLDALGDAFRTKLAATPLASPVPAGISLRDDLVAWFRVTIERSRLVGSATFRGLIGEADMNALQDLAGLGTEAAGELLDEIVRPARERGELGSRTIPHSVLVAPLRVLRDQTVFEPSSVDAERLVDEIAVPLYRHASGLGASPASDRPGR